MVAVDSHANGVAQTEEIPFLGLVPSIREEKLENKRVKVSDR